MTVSDANLDRYVDAWLRHVRVKGPEGEEHLRAYLGVVSDDIGYEDVPTGRQYTGHDAIRQLCTFVSENYDVDLRAVSWYTDGERFTIEWESTTVWGQGQQPLEGRGVAVGTIGADGKITSHRDYYNRPVPPP